MPASFESVQRHFILFCKESVNWIMRRTNFPSTSILGVAVAVAVAWLRYFNATRPARQ